MSKNILILSSSPRRGGNSDTLCDEFMRGAIESGNQVEKIFLRDKNIHPCTGCSVCSRYKKPCPQKDDACGRCHRDGNTGLFLCYECPDENDDRPLLRTL